MKGHLWRKSNVKSKYVTSDYSPGSNPVTSQTMLSCHCRCKWNMVQKPYENMEKYTTGFPGCLAFKLFFLFCEGYKMFNRNSLRIFTNNSLHTK